MAHTLRGPRSMRTPAWLLLLPACLATGDADDQIDGAFSISVSPRDTALVLDLVNYLRVDVERLDLEAGLDARAAAGIVAHRNGPDAIAGTADDDPFDTLTELDAVRWVGDSALTKLLSFARTYPVPASLAVEGVAFQGWQTESVVWGVNQATFAELDDGLDARAARALVDGAPFASLDQIAAAPYVGAAALASLRAKAPAWWQEMVGSPSGPCTVAVSGRADQAASDLSTLLSIATTLDWPFANLTAQSIPDCVDARIGSPQAAELNATLAAYARSTWGSGIDPTASGLTAGGAHFVALVTTAHDRISERVADGAWAPADAAEQALLDRLPALIDALTAGPSARPADYVELPLSTDAEECSEYGSLLIEVSTGRGWMIHQFPRC